MATSVITASVVDINQSRRSTTRTIKVVAAAGDYLAAGWTLDLTAVTNPNNLPAAKFGQNPTINFTVKKHPIGYICYVTPGSTLANWKIAFSRSGTADAIFNDVTAAAAPAGIVTPFFVLIDFTSPKNL